MKKRIEIKPISVNTVWQGRRFKTPAYKVYEEELLYLLPNLKIPEGKLEVIYRFGINIMADYDNCVKPFQDVLQKKYNFDDKNIYKATIYKEVVSKGNEFVEFEIKSM